MDLTGVVTGPTNVTGLTNPTWTFTADANPSPTGKQWYVSALGGTQTGVSLPSASSPWTVSWFRPAQLNLLGPIRPETGQLSAVPKNRWTLILRQGLLPLSGQPKAVGIVRCSFDVPAGVDLADVASLRAMCASLASVLWSKANDIANDIIGGRN